MSYLMGQVVIWVVVTFVACLVVTWLAWGRRLQRFEAQLVEQKTMYEYCVAECGWLRQALSELRDAEPGQSRWEWDARSGPVDDGMDSARQELPDSPERAREEDTDDLTRIKGIGPRLNQRLNDLGIYRYSQIAELTRENIDWLDAHLPFKGRIDREKWVEQARTLTKRSDPGSAGRREQAMEASYSPKIY